MEVKNAVMPTSKQMKGFFEDDHGKSISMINLLKFREKADYPADHELHGKDMTGAEAYDIYGEEVSKLLDELGGELRFSGDVKRLVLGEIGELWDKVAIASYPNRQAMVGMMMSDGYRAIEAHRNAGLAGQLNIETVETEF